MVHPAAFVACHSGVSRFAGKSTVLGTLFNPVTRFSFGVLRPVRWKSSQLLETRGYRTCVWHATILCQVPYRWSKLHNQMGACVVMQPSVTG